MELLQLAYRQASVNRLNYELKRIADLNSRIKMDSFHSYPLGEYRLTRNMNFPTPFYKYDCQEKSVQFKQRDSTS